MVFAVLSASVCALGKATAKCCLINIYFKVYLENGKTSWNTKFALKSNLKQESQLSMFFQKEICSCIIFKTRKYIRMCHC